MESLDQHTRNLPKLEVGDLVFVQNQRGSHPTKWDVSGVVMEIGNHDKYTVKVDGTGRVTTRNRRFLRKYTRPTLDIPHETTLPPLLNINPPPSDHSLEPTHHTQRDPQGEPMLIADNSDSSTVSRAHQPTDSSTSQGPVAGQTTEESHNPDTLRNTTPTVHTETRVSNRVRLPPKRYIPETGTWE